MKMLFVICISLFSLAAFSADFKSFQMSGGKVKLSVLKGWQEARQLFGVELTFLGPMKAENRPVVTIDMTDFSNFKFNEKSLKKNEEDYKEGREKWLSKYHGRSVDFFPYEVKKTSSSLTAHMIGFRYEMGGKIFSERSVYMTCGKNLYHIKTLLLTDEEASYKEELDQLIDNFNCI